MFDRRTCLTGGAAVAAVTGGGLIHRYYEEQANVFIARNQRYDGPLERTIRDGLLATGVVPEQLRGKRVLLKPNLVEPARAAPQMTTNPAIVVAVAAVFARWKAQVVVGEAPGHVRDTEWALVESGLREAIDSERLDFADLNYEETLWVPNQGRASSLSGFHLPETVGSADLIVSLPKLKTHHWMGMTGALKNMYGVIPGIRYGWPKNVLHHHGIPETVFDINASIPPMITVVDGILAMEGDGPIMGSPKPMGLVVVGTNATATDATICRLMHLEPRRIPYLKLAARRLGPLRAGAIHQQGENYEPLATPFEILDRPHLQVMRAGEHVT